MSCSNFGLGQELPSARRTSLPAADDERRATRVEPAHRSSGKAHTGALSSYTPPVRGTPLFDIADGEMEVGIGIHGEPGRERRKMGTANEIVDVLLGAIVPDLPFKSGDEVALMVNGLGGTPISELYLLYGVAHKKLLLAPAEVAVRVF